MLPAHPDNGWDLVVGQSKADYLGAWHTRAGDIFHDGLAGAVLLFDDVGVRLAGADVASLLPPVDCRSKQIVFLHSHCLTIVCFFFFLCSDSVSFETAHSHFVFHNISFMDARKRGTRYLISKVDRQEGHRRRTDVLVHDPTEEHRTLPVSVASSSDFPISSPSLSHDPTLGNLFQKSQKIYQLPKWCTHMWRV